MYTKLILKANTWNVHYKGIVVLFINAIEMDPNSEQNFQEFRQTVIQALERLRAKGLECDDSRMRNALKSEFEEAIKVITRTAFNKGEEYEARILNLNTENRGLKKALNDQQIENQRLANVNTYTV